jgi:hypothetical protein
VTNASLPGGGPAARRTLAGLIVAIVLGISVVVGLVVAGAGPVPAAATRPSPSSAPSAAVAASPTLAGQTLAPPTTAPTPTPTEPLVAAPLTGLPVSLEASLRHPIAVMIDDHVDARPQSGFNAAAVVWQAPAEGGIPRYMLIFQDQVPAAVGPVRSSREYFIEWAAEWTAMYVHAGGSPEALATLRERGRGDLVWNADEFRWEGIYLWRVTSRLAPHNVFTDGPHLRAMATVLGAKDGPIKPVWHFAPDRSLDVRPDGGRIVVTYPYESITYRYDPLTNTYHRFINGSRRPQVDAADGQVVAPKNVVILRMFFGPLNDGHPEKHRLEAADVGHGVAWIATNGQTVKGTWRKASEDAPTLLFGPDGKPFVLTAGQTFVQVLPLTYGLTVRDGSIGPQSMMTTGGLTAR